MKTEDNIDLIVSAASENLSRSRPDLDRDVFTRLYTRALESFVAADFSSATADLKKLEKFVTKDVKKVVKSFRLSESLYDEFADLASFENVSITELVAKSMEEYRTKHSERFRQSNMHLYRNTNT